MNLGYTKIFSPSDGSLGEFSVHPGQLVGAGQQVVNLVQSGVWVQANFRETQLGRAKQGDRADIRIDALPSKTFHGHILEIAPASGSQFALLPPDNAHRQLHKSGPARAGQNCFGSGSILAPTETGLFRRGGNTPLGRWW